MAGHTDNHTLATLQLGFVRGLIIVLGIAADDIGVSFLIVVELRQSGVKPGLDSIQVHLVGIEYFFIYYLLEI